MNNDRLSASGDSESENDDELGLKPDDIEAIQQACIPSNSKAASDGEDSDLQVARAIQTRFGAAATESNPDYGGESASESDSDLELARSIQSRFGGEPAWMKPLTILPPEGEDEEEDDFEILRAIQRRFAAYDRDSLMDDTGTSGSKPEQVCASSIFSGREVASKLLIDRTNASKAPSFALDACNAAQDVTENTEAQQAGLIELHQPDAPKSLPFESSNFPTSAHAFIDAIKKNRVCQKFLRTKLLHIEAKIEENKKLMERVKVLRDFQAACRKRTGRALSQKMDPRVQLISVQRPRPPKDLKVKEGKVSAMYYGPMENSHAANYRMALTRFPISLHREKWSDAEKDSLRKGVWQELQRVAYSSVVDSQMESDCFDKMCALVSDFEITPERARKYLREVDWDLVASTYVRGRSAIECEARWLNWEDPLVNHNPWTREEDKKLLSIVKEKGVNDWFTVALSLDRGRTPFQCLARYQRSLNPSIMKSEWTKEEDSQLRIAVEIFGESDWQSVASALEGRTGTQCSNRWKKTLNPARQRVGRWAEDEDKRLRVAVMLFGPRNWNKIAEFVRGRTQAQCRERWVNCLDPSLNFDMWTEEEDLKLKAAIAEHGYSWSKIAACVPHRTDNQCRRRWKVLCPDEVPLLQKARMIEKTAFISNFVDRETERPALCPNDFNATPMICSATQTEDANSSKRGQRRKRSRLQYGKGKDSNSCSPKVQSLGTMGLSSSVEALDNNGDVYLLPPESVESATSIDNGNEVFGSSWVVLRRKRTPRRRTTVPSEDEGQNSTLPSEVLPDVTGGSEVLRDSDKTNADEKCKEKRGSKSRLNMGRTILRVRGQGSADNSMGSTISDKKEGAFKNSRRKTTTETYEEQQDCTTASCQEDKFNKRKRGDKSNSNQRVLEVSNDDDIALNCIFHKKSSRKRKLGDMIIDNLEDVSSSGGMESNFCSGNADGGN